MQYIILAALSRMLFSTEICAQSCAKGDESTEMRMRDFCQRYTTVSLETAPSPPPHNFRNAS